MILNLLHRPEEGDKHSLYKLQQEYAHKLKLKVTLMISVQAMENEMLVEEILHYHKNFGDELALWLWSFEKKEFGGDAPFWLLSRQNKQDGLKYALELFERRFGCEPASAGSYVMDSSSLELLKELSPGTKTVIAGCFEEGTKVYHGCNNSWYLFSEGVSWGPWYPAKEHSFRPASDESDWSGFVAVPHLSRDLSLAYEGRNDFFSSHPANVQRGLGNHGLLHPYDFNLIDQYLMQEDYNDGYSFYHVHVSPGWLGNNSNIYDTPEISQKIYLETLEYLAGLRNQGKISDMYMNEFGEWYLEHIPIGKPGIAVGKEILFGSGKHYFWISDPAYRVLLDANQGGSIGDLRPYAGHFSSFSGADSPLREIASYPYIIQSQLRTGTVTHFTDGSRTTLFITDGHETLDMCYYTTKIASVSRNEASIEVCLTPVEMSFQSGLTVQIETAYEFCKEGRIMIKRRLLGMSHSKTGLWIQEYVKGCYGFTEYPEDMHGILLTAKGRHTETISYDYNSRSIQVDSGEVVSADIPYINTRLSLEPVGACSLHATAEEGHLFNPYFTLKLDYDFSKVGKEAVTCLTIQKM